MIKDLSKSLLEAAEAVVQENRESGRYSYVYQTALKFFGVMSPEELGPDKRAEFERYLQVNLPMGDLADSGSVNTQDRGEIQADYGYPKTFDADPSWYPDMQPVAEVEPQIYDPDGDDDRLEDLEAELGVDLDNDDEEGEAPNFQDIDMYESVVMEDIYDNLLIGGRKVPVIRCGRLTTYSRVNNQEDMDEIVRQFRIMPDDVSAIVVQGNGAIALMHKSKW